MRILGLGIPELLAILLVCLLIFGANKLPEIGRALGKTIKELKKALKDEDNSEEQERPSNQS